MAFFGRGANKIQHPYTLVDMYPFYLEQVGHNPIYQLEYNEYVDIISDYYKAISEHVLDGGKFKLAYKLGELFIIKKKINVHKKKTMPIDWALTNEVCKKVVHLNEHSGGFKYLFHWEKRNQSLKNLYSYRLVLTRANKRKLARLIKEENYDYFEQS